MAISRVFLISDTLNADCFQPFNAQWSLYEPPPFCIKKLNSTHTEHLHVPCDPHNEERLFTRTALAVWPLPWRRSGIPVRQKLVRYVGV
jgi:hypothetical protein